MSEISEAEIKSMSTEQNYMRGYKDGKSDVIEKIKGYIDYIRNTGMGKMKSLEFIEKFIEGIKSESEGKE